MPVFEGILSRQGQLHRLSGSAIAVTVVYAVMMVAALCITGDPPKARATEEKKLVVTLLDLPKVSDVRSLGESGRSGGGGADEAPEPTAPEPPVSAPVRAPKAPKERVAKPAPVEDKALAREGAVAEPAKPEPPVKPATGDAPNSAAPDKPQPNAAASNAASSTGQGSGVGGNSGSGVGSGVGTGSGGGNSGLGSGSGARSGAASGDATVLPFMDGMTRPELVSKVDPDYTREARDANVEGLILTKCVITTTGTLRNCRIVKGLPLMDQAVLSALAKWRYSPVMYQGKPAAVEYVIPVRLKMN